MLFLARLENLLRREILFLEMEEESLMTSLGVKDFDNP